MDLTCRTLYKFDWIEVLVELISVLKNILFSWNKCQNIGDILIYIIF